MPFRRLSRRRLPVFRVAARLGLFLLGFGLLAAPARGQDDQGDQQDQPNPPGLAGGGPRERADADTGGVTLIDRLGIEPQYSTSVDVNKTAVGWNQSLKMARELGSTRIENSWSVIRNQNSAQNNYELHDGKMATKVEYHLPGTMGFSTGANLNAKKTLSVSDVGRTIRNSNQFDWFLAADAPGQWLTRLFRLEEGSVNWSVTGTAGLTQTVDVRQTSQKDVTSNRFELSRSDSTQADGQSTSGASRLSWAPSKAWTIDLSGSSDTGSLESRTRQIQRDIRADSVLADSMISEPSRNRSRRAAWSAAWSPRPSTRIAFSGQEVRTYDRSYSALVKGFDTTNGMDSKVGLDLKVTPIWGIAIDSKGEIGKTDLAYSRNVAQGRGREAKRLEMSATFTLGRPFGALQRMQSTSILRWEDADNTFQAAKSFRSKLLNLSQQFRKPIGQRFVVVMKGEGSLNQSFYRDASQDRDDLRLLGDLTIGYRPNQNWDTRISGQLGKKKSLALASAISASSFTTNSYQIGAEATYQPAPRIRINQKYTFSADYSFYNFEENRNFLARLTEVRTSFQGLVGTRASLELVHLWQFRDSGRFGRVTTGAPRAYTKQTEDIYQTLEAKTGYKFTEGFQLSARQRIEVRDRSRLDTGVKTHAREGLEFAGGMTLDHSFSRDFTVTAKVERTQSTREKNFWRVNAGATRNF